MRKIRFRNLIIILMLFFLTGCWDSLGISKKNIVMTVIVDKTDVGYSFTVEVASVMGGKSESGPPSSKKNVILKAEGKDFTEARKKIEQQSDKVLYLGGDQCVIFTQKMAESGIEEYVFRLRQIPDYRKTVKVVMTTENPDDLLHAATQNDMMVGIAITNLLQNLSDEGHNIDFKLADLLDKMSSKCSDYLIPVIGLDNNFLKVTGYAVFQREKMIGIIPMEDSEGIIMFLAKKPKNNFSVDYLNNRFTVELQHFKKSVKAYYTDGKVDFSVTLDCELMLLYLEHLIQVTDEVMAGLSSEISKMLKDDIEQAIALSQIMYKDDFLGFHDYFRIRYPDIAKQTDWKTVFPSVTFNVKIKVDLKTSSKIDYDPEQNT